MSNMSTKWVKFFLFIYIRIKPAYPLYPVGMSMGITLQYLMGMGMGMSINFENEYG